MFGRQNVILVFWIKSCVVI